MASKSTAAKVIHVKTPIPAGATQQDAIHVYNDGTLVWSLDASGNTQVGAGTGRSVTLTDVVNTAAKTTYATFGFAANEIADGDVIDITVAGLAKNNSGALRTPIFLVSLGAVEVNAPEFAGDWGTSASEFKVIYSYQMIRVGADLWIYRSDTQRAPIWTLTGAQLANHATVITNPGFTTALTMNLKLDFPVAHADLYLKPKVVSVKTT